MLFGHDGADTLVGGDGIDLLDGGPGADVLDGGAGWDEANYYYSPAGVTVDLAAGRGYGGDAEGDRLFGIEYVSGSFFDDVFVGNDGDNYLAGQNGSDRLHGLGGADYLDGGIGPDQLFGNTGDDTLMGQDDDDVLNGGSGIDYLVGGTGADRFVWALSTDTGVTRLTADFVEEFRFVDGDRFDLASIDADVYAAGNQAFRFIGAAAFSGAPGELRYYHFGNMTYLEMQTGTSTDVEGVIALRGIHTPQANWFVL
jgi:Ca2+-binding RTX toxin-like protein